MQTVREAAAGTIVEGESGMKSISLLPARRAVGGSDEGVAMDKKIQAPDEMLKAAVAAMKERSGTKFCSTEQWAALGLEAALGWLADEWEPSEELLIAIQGELKPYVEDLTPFTLRNIATILSIASRRMFLAPEPEIPEAVKDLLVEPFIRQWRGEELNKAVIEAYKRGLKEGNRC